MAEDNRGRLTIDVAVEQVGRAMYGDAWIGSLTKREDWLIRRYVEGVAPASEASSMMRGSVRWEIGGRKWAECPGDPKIVEEVEQARDRRDFMEEQSERAFDWLEDHGFDPDASSLDREALFSALAGMTADSESVEISTGAPGRPSVIQFVEKEAERRRSANEALPKISAEAQELHSWCAKKHPSYPTPTAKTIENRIREAHRKWRTPTPHN